MRSLRFPVILQGMCKQVTHKSFLEKKCERKKIIWTLFCVYMFCRSRINFKFHFFIADIFVFIENRYPSPDRSSMKRS